VKKLLDGWVADSANQKSMSGGYDKDKTDCSKSELARPFCSQIVIMICRQGVITFRENRDPHSSLVVVL